MAIFAKSPKTRIFLKNAKKGPRKTFKRIAYKVALSSKPKSTLTQTALSSNYYAVKVQRLEKVLRHKSGSKSAPMAKLWQFLQGHLEPAFSEKVLMVDQGKCFKNRPKSSPRLKGPKALWRKWHYPLISMYLRWKDWRRFWDKKAAPKGPEWPRYSNFCKVTQNPHFLKKCKGGSKRNLSKIA